jgi:hypothetical protein
MKTKIKILIASFVIAAAAVTGFNLAQENSNMDVSLADIGVMAQASGEQPNTDDCIPDDNYDCEALHPTDPELDKIRYDHKWE